MFWEFLGNRKTCLKHFATIVADKMNVTVIAATTKVIVDADAKTITLGVHALDAKKQPIYIEKKPLMVEGIVYG